MKIKEKTCYYYRLYNLNIKSDFYLSELSHSEYPGLNNIDVNIICGKCPESISNIKVSNYYYTVSDKEAIFTTNECGKFYIKNGDTIIIEPIEIPNYQHLKSYLLSRSFAILLFQRNTVALHGSSILFDDNIYTFCGRSGAGKSSLSAALTIEGYKMLSDDLSVVEFDNNKKPLIYSGFAQHKLCADTIDYFNISPDSLIKVDHNINKFAIPTDNCFVNESYPLSIIIEITVDYKNENNNLVTITELTGEKKLQAIFRNTFKPEMLSDIGLNIQYLNQCLNIAKNIKVFKLSRPKGIFTLKEQISLIKEIQN